MGVYFRHFYYLVCRLLGKKSLHDNDYDLVEVVASKILFFILFAGVLCVDNLK